MAFLSPAHIRSYVLYPLYLLFRALFMFASFVVISGLVLKFLFSFFPWTVCFFCYLNHATWPPKYIIDFSNLSMHSLQGDNLYLRSNGITLGVWRIPPEGPLLPSATELPVILYVHGNAGTRASFTRVELYKNLRKMGFTIVAFDYRGYGDSSGAPWGEHDLVLDGYAVYEWIRKEYPEKEVFIWGHSLGTGVSTHLVQHLEGMGHAVDGLVLDSPFSDMLDAARKFPLLSPFHMVPGFTDSFTSAMRTMSINLNNSAAILTLKVPVLILHAEDDRIVPIELGRKLYATAKQRPEPVEFVTFRAELGYGHKGIYRDPDLPRIVNDFFTVCRQYRDSKRANIHIEKVEA
ncbi:lysophosphatidylserine lipase ABHD12-like [Paramacrobiotus metropolitanus]|uniref:lysophosphatidylserine lipase ABHD12-like n=1 Tax=Paramacrobiotus metropolitanus TaxID=2943436 RepID=UPI002445E2B6|nr:lysophosphatidylserine lipase ABHD12-like [Paramacrobiotus metropolitanus]